MTTEIRAPLTDEEITTRALAAAAAYRAVYVHRTSKPVFGEDWWAKDKALYREAHFAWLSLSHAVHADIYELDYELDHDPDDEEDED